MNVYHVNKTITNFGGLFRGIGQAFVWTHKSLKEMGFKNTLIDLTSKREDYKNLLRIEGLDNLEYINQYWGSEDYISDIELEGNFCVIDQAFDKGIIHTWDNIPVKTDAVQIVTVHDTFLLDSKYMWMKNDENRLRDVPGILNKLRNARAIVCPSEFSKKDILELLGNYKGIIRVIPWGSKYQNQFTFPKLPSELRDKKFFLYVSCAERRKSFEQLVEAFNKINDKDLNLVVVSDHTLLNKDERKFLFDFLSSSTNVFHYRNLDTDDLGTLMKEALAVIMTSSYEGFGMPVVEAASLETKVIVREASSMAEFKKFATFYDGTLDGLIDRMNELRHAKIKEKRFDKADFNYHKTASEYATLYKELS